MNDLIDHRVQRLLDLALELRDSIDELLAGLAKELELAGKDAVAESPKRRRRKARRAL